MICTQSCKSNNVTRLAIFWKMQGKRKWGWPRNNWRISCVHERHLLGFNWTTTAQLTSGCCKTMDVLSSQDDYRDKDIHIADEGLCRSSFQLYMHSLLVSQMSLFWITIKPQIFFHYWILAHYLFHFHLLFVPYILSHRLIKLHDVVIGCIKRWSVKEVFR